jgi:hypothetical protein
VNAPVHVKYVSDGSKRLLQFYWTQREAIFRKADTHKEGPVMMVCSVLVGLYDVALVFKDEL